MSLFERAIHKRIQETKMAMARRELKPEDGNLRLRALGEILTSWRKR